MGASCNTLAHSSAGLSWDRLISAFPDAVLSSNMHPNLWTIQTLSWVLCKQLQADAFSHPHTSSCKLSACSAVCWFLFVCGQHPFSESAVASTVGAALAFPGAAHIEVGQSTAAPPFVTGLGPIFMTWICAPGFGSVMVVLCLLYARSTIMRGEDTFHRALWVSPCKSISLLYNSSPRDNSHSQQWSHACTGHPSMHHNP